MLTRAAMNWFISSYVPKDDLLESTAKDRLIDLGYGCENKD
jgi:hypothetical protein